jgi:5'-AMP-activated protein kinase catalytic alpha subunit
MDEEKKRKVGKYVLGEVIGDGSFGEVMEAVHQVTGEKVAIKELDKDRVQDRNMGAQLQKEIAIMKKLKHGHVIQLKEVLASRSSIFMVLEFAGGGDLHEHLVGNKRFDEKTARSYLAQIISAVQFCHERGVCHRDLKPENILLDDQGNLKLADFGLADLIHRESDSNSGSDSDEEEDTVGTLHYIAPEAISAFKEGTGRKCDPQKMDTWACGVVLYILLAGYLPFEESTKDALFKKIEKIEYKCPTWFSAEVREFIGSFMVGPEDRITLAAAMSHPWMLAKAPEIRSAEPKHGNEAGSAQAKGSEVELPDELKEQGAVSASKILERAKADADADAELEGAIGKLEVAAKASTAKLSEANAMDKNDSIFAAFEAKMEAKKAAATKQAAASALSRLTGAAKPGTGAGMQKTPSSGPPKNTLAPGETSEDFFAAMEAKMKPKLQQKAKPKNAAAAAAGTLARLMGPGAAAGKTTVCLDEGPPKNTLAEGETSKDFFAAMEARLKPKLGSKQTSL